MENKYLYIYNIKQVDFYLRNKCYPINCGINPSTNKIWHKFIKKDTSKVYLQWLNNK